MTTRQFKAVDCSTNGEPGDVQFVVELSVGRRGHWEVTLVHKVKVQDEHDHQAIFILHWHHIHEAGKTHTCLQRAHKCTPVFRQDIQIPHLNECNTMDTISIEISPDFSRVDWLLKEHG